MGCLVHLGVWISLDHAFRLDVSWFAFFAPEELLFLSVSAIALLAAGTYKMGSLVVTRSGARLCVRSQGFTRPLQSTARTS